LARKALRALPGTGYVDDRTTMIGCQAYRGYCSSRRWRAFTRQAARGSQRRARAEAPGPEPASGSPRTAGALGQFATHHEVGDLRRGLAVNVEIAPTKLFNEALRGLAVRSQNTLVAVARAWPDNMPGLVNGRPPPRSKSYEVNQSAARRFGCDGAAMNGSAAPRQHKLCRKTSHFPQLGMPFRNCGQGHHSNLSTGLGSAGGVMEVSSSRHRDSGRQGLARRRPEKLCT
jgi:hypothetical protein